MKQLGYAQNYKYAHDYKDHFVVQQFLPDGIQARFWHAQENPAEQKLKDRMVQLWGERFKE